MDRLDKAIVVLCTLLGMVVLADIYLITKTWHPPHACVRIAEAIDIAGDCRR